MIEWSIKDLEPGGLFEVPTLPLTSCVTMGKSLSLFPSLWNGNDDDASSNYFLVKM